MRHILRCPDCLTYTLLETCPKCSTATVSSRPMKYSPDDKYASYRRKAKVKELEEKGLI